MAVVLTIDDLMSDELHWNTVIWENAERIVNRLQTRIVKAVKGCRMPDGILSRLEPCEGKLSPTVLRGPGAGNSPWLHGTKPLRLYWSLMLCFGWLPPSIKIKTVRTEPLDIFVKVYSLEKNGWFCRLGVSCFGSNPTSFSASK